MVLETLRDSVFDRMGLDTGDVILRINGIPVSSRRELRLAFSMYSWWMEVEYMGHGDGLVRSVTMHKKLDEPLGLIIAPGEGDPPNVHLRSKGYLLRKIEELKNKWS